MLSWGNSMIEFLPTSRFAINQIDCSDLGVAFLLAIATASRASIFRYRLVVMTSPLQLLGALTRTTNDRCIAAQGTKHCSHNTVSIQARQGILQLWLVMLLKDIRQRQRPHF